MTKVVVSFTNVFPSGLALGIFDFETADFKWIDLSNIYDYKKITGAAGICSHKNLFTTYWFTTQHENYGSSLLALDNNFNVLKIYKLTGTFDAHTLTPFENGFLITDTLRNAVNKIQIGSDANGLFESEYWRGHDEQIDAVHVNSVCVINGQVYVSMFGEKPKEGWFYARNGKIINISKNKVICDNLFHPHSLLNIDGILYWLESATSKVHRFSEEKGHEIILRLSGYLRGITYDDKYFYIASSASRRQTTTTGTINVPPSGPDDMHSWIYRINRENLEVDRQRLTAFGAEIFDLLIFEDSHLQMGIDNTDPILRRLCRYDEEYLSLKHVSENKTRELEAYILKVKELQDKVKELQDIISSNQEDLTNRNSTYFKEHVFELLKELWHHSYYIIPNMGEDEFKLEVALKLLNMIENVHMSTAEKQFELYKKAEKKYGIHILYAHYYSALPILSQLSPDIWEKRHEEGIDWNEKVGLQLIEELSNYYSEYENILDSNEFDDSGQYGWLDAALYYCMIRKFKPKNIIEVGAGDSTKLAALAARKNGGIELKSIDPFASENLSEITKFIKEPVQEIPISQFKALERNDILFVDSSHVCKIGSDVNYLYLDVLPNLNPGVLIHIHDIALPLEFPNKWVIGLHRFWNEQYLLHAFLIGNCAFEVLFGVQYMLLHHRDLLLKLYGSKRLGGRSFWIRKIK